jgi:hypothetical protein
MCLYPKIIDNKRYKPNNKNGFCPPAPPTDPRALYVPVGCGRCIECRKQKANNWKIRLNEEIRHNSKATFVTLTFSEESLLNIKKKINKVNEHSYELDNEIASYAVRHFTELWRKHHKKTVRHWLITELGHNGTERIHLHGIIWTEKPEEIKKIWKYGFIFLGTFVNEQTINYIAKYVTKTDKMHKEYQSKIYTSKGLGAKYLERTDSLKNEFKDKETDELYKTRKGTKLALPTYYRNKLWTENERERLWLNRLDKNERYVLGMKIDLNHPDGDNHYYNALKEARIFNKMWGYGDDTKNWDLKKYEEKRKKLKQKQYIAKIKNDR